MNRLLHAARMALLAALWAGTAWAQPNGTIVGAGSSAAAPIYRSWAQAYEKATGITLAYEPAGSSAGLKKIRAREVQFGASDVAPPAADLERDGLVVFPVAITGIAPVVNLPRLGDVPLRLTGPLLARIYLGEVTQWNHPDIARLNPALSLPAAPIRVVARSDGSGTTYNFADYLAKVSPDWGRRMGVKTSYEWPATTVLGKGSSGVVKAVKDTPGAIGYVDFGYVQDSGLMAVDLQNREGEWVRPSTFAFRTALVNSEWTTQGRFTGTLTQQTGRGSWPITMGTFILLPRVVDQPEQALQAMQFFVWAFMNGDALVQAQNFVRLPDRVQAAAFRAIASVKDARGASVGTRLMVASVPAP